MVDTCRVVPNEEFQCLFMYCLSGLDAFARQKTVNTVHCTQGGEEAVILFCGLKLLVACVRLPPCVSIVLQAGILFSVHRSVHMRFD